MAHREDRYQLAGLVELDELPQKGYQHERIIASQTDILETMRRLQLHTMVSNAKAFIGGIFHGLDSKYLQSYLDEIGYRFNHRHILNRIFERCVVAMLECPIWTYWDIIASLQYLKNHV
jgi:hypothetical protein